jgi:hypothetical protein
VSDFRYTKTHAVQAFLRLAAAVGVPHNADAAGYSGSPEGTWWLDHEPVYGGYVIQEAFRLTNRDGLVGQGVSSPLGHTRRSAREFVQAVDFALDVLRVKEQRA